MYVSPNDAAAQGGMGFYNNPLLFPVAQSLAFTSNTMTHGFDYRAMGTVRGLAGYARGRQYDHMIARKLTGTTYFGNRYRNLAMKYPGLGRAAPTLSHLAPSRYLTFASAVGGNQDAMQALRFMAATQDQVRTFSNIAGTSLTESYGILYGGRPNPAGVTRNRGRPEFDLRPGSLRAGFGDRVMPISTGGELPHGGKTIKDIGLGKATTTAQQDRYLRLFNLRQSGMLGESLRRELDETPSLVRLEAHIREANRATSSAAKVAHFTGAAEAVGMGTVGAKVGGGIARLGGNATAIKAFSTIKPVANIAGKAFLGFDVYHLAGFAGKWGFKGTMALAELPGKIYSGITREMHRGTFMSAGSLSPFVGATGRQRAMATIYEKQLNLRQALGNESSLMFM